MKREILFRGKRVDTGEWIYGDLIKNSIIDPFTYIAIGVGYKIDNPEIGKAIKVFPNTVGQFTGITDKNGTKIFEGDVFKIGAEDNIYTVKFDYGCFLAYEDDVQVGILAELATMFIKKIGNIHDNKELLK